MANQLLPPAPCCNPCCPSTSTTLEDIIAEVIEDLDLCSQCPQVIVRDTTAAMRAITAYEDDWFFVTLGGAAKSDGSGKDWYYDPASLAADDGSDFTVVIRPDNKPIGEAGRLLQRL